jgi:hypothetical protein
LSSEGTWHLDTSGVASKSYGFFEWRIFQVNDYNQCLILISYSPSKNKSKLCRTLGEDRNLQSCLEQQHQKMLLLDLTLGCNRSKPNEFPRT